ncbi:helix-turn-helix domain-containing protein [Bosea sp. 2RAB26]|uniref:helix-turn-helix domain-containing protein n=1 Tax=Bosea sp. 2RAB26 TaxID=3237476 RepID=UPI003F90FEFB
MKPERMRSEAAAAILGVGRRIIQSMALRGELPGAAKIGGLWTFDEEALGSYIRERTSRPKDRYIEPGVDKPERRLPLKAKNSAKAAEEARRRLLRGK